MKKKLFALFLSVLMVSAGGTQTLAASDSVDVFQSAPEEEALFDDQPAAGDEGSDFTSGSSEGALFSDEKQLLDVEEGDTVLSNAGAGVTASTSVYYEGASFGQQKALDALTGTGTVTSTYGWYYHASPETTSYYTDASGNFHIVAYHASTNQLYDGVCGSQQTITKLTKVDLPLPVWGGFYAAPDGCFYVVVGQMNEEESPTKTVVRILKYSSSWKLLGTVDVPGGVTNMFQGIYIPFDAASLRMAQTGSVLLVHTGREMFAMDGVHHQSNITFAVNTDTMELLQTNEPYVSHSFNQFVVTDGSRVYFLDHGDAYDRGLILSDFTLYGSTHLSGNREVNLFPFLGEIGENYTGAEVTGFSLLGNTLVTIGKSVPHEIPVQGETGMDSSLNQNVFVILTDTNMLQSRFFWMTQNAPSGEEIFLTEPKLVKLDENRFALLFSTEENGKPVLYYDLMNTGGELLLEKRYEGVSLRTDSQPALYQNTIRWIAAGEESDYDDETPYLYQIPVVTTALTGISLDADAVTINDGETKALNLQFAPANTDDVKDVKWSSSNASLVSVSQDGVITGKGYGKAVITATVGTLKAQCTVTVNVPASDEPLARPVITVTQKRSDKLHITWKKVAGAKGYQVYYKTSPKASYKRIATLKDGSLSYDVSVTAGKKYYFKVRAYGIRTDGKYKYSASSAAKSKIAAVLAPAKITCGFADKGTEVIWSKVTGATGYVVYRSGRAAKTVKPSSQTSWTDTTTYVSEGTRWVYDYYVRAYRMNGSKRVYSKPTKTVNLFDR